MSEDLIRRSDAVHKIAEFLGVPARAFIHEAENLLKDVPSAQQWIPVTERLPEEEVDVLVTRHFHSDNVLRKKGITEKYYVEVANRIDDEWVSYSDEYKIRRHLHEVVAWMPLPKPWEGGAEE